jgi:quercetin dioxygenase-like cupin family protein
MSTESPPINVLLRSEESDGQVAVISSAVPAGFPGPPLHTHEFDEAFYVLEGELTFEVAGERATAGPGELAFAPRGIPHTYANFSGRAARFLLVCTPAGFERYFARMGAEREGVEPPAWAMQPIPEVVRVGPRIEERERSDP